MGKRKLPFDNTSNSKHSKLSAFGFKSTAEKENSPSAASDALSNDSSASVGDFKVSNKSLTPSNRKFQVSWKFDRPWHIYDANKRLMFCDICIKAQMNNTLTVGCSILKKDQLIKHTEAKDENREENGQTKSGATKTAEGLEEKKDDREAGELSGEEESQEKDDDDDSDDDVQVTIGDIQTFPLNEPRNLFKTQGGYQKPVVPAASNKAQTGTTTTQKGPDLDAAGTINGVNQYEFDLDGLQAEEKPWRKPGADITDYFNYGFNEDSWRLYCEKQRRMRMDNQGGERSLGSGTRIYVHQSGTAPHAPRTENKKESLHPPGTETPQTVPVIGPRGKTASIPQRKMGGTIDVIGSTARDSRRPDTSGDPIPVAGSRKSYNTSVPPPGIPTHPPPGMPPMPDFAVPPPGMPPPNLHAAPGTAPPGVPSAIPPPGFPPDFDPFYPPPGQAPVSHYDDRAFSSHATYTSGYNPTTHAWDNRNDAYRWGDYTRERSPARSESEFSSSGSERDYRYPSSRDRRYERDRDRSERDSYSRRDRDSYRDRERSRSRERSSRDHRHRDDKHKSRSSRKDDSDHHRSKHKKSKKSKREKDEDLYDPAVPSQESSQAD